jgi:hypothetical protein
MLDVLRESHGLQATDNADEADVLLFNTCSIREKAQEKVFHQLGRWRKLKEEAPGPGDRRGRLRGQPGRAAIIGRAPYVDLVFGPQTLHRLPEMLDRGSPANARPAGGHQLPRDREVRPPAGARGRGRERLRLDHGRLQQVLQLLRGALHPRGEEVSRPLDDVLAEIAQLAAAGRARGERCSARTSTPTAAATADGEMTDFAELLHLVAARSPASSASATPPRTRIEFSDALIEAYATSRKLVSHVHLPVQSGSDRVLAAMKRGHTVLEYKSDHPQAARRAPGHQHFLGLHRRLPRRDGGGLRGHHEADRGDRLRPLVQLRLQRAPRHPGRRPAGRRRQEVKKLASPACRTRSITSPCSSAAPCWARCSASWWRADITFGIGPAGTGKTFLAVAMAPDASTQQRSSASSSPARRSRPASASASCRAT